MPGWLFAGAGAGAWTTVTVPVPGELVTGGGVLVVGGLLAAAVTVTPTAALVELCRLDPDAGVKTAVSFAVDAVNDVGQNTVKFWPPTGRLAQPLIGVPRFSKVMAPAGAGAPALELTVAIKVTV